MVPVDLVIVDQRITLVLFFLSALQSTKRAFKVIEHLVVGHTVSNQEVASPHHNELTHFVYMFSIFSKQNCSF